MGYWKRIGRASAGSLASPPQEHSGLVTVTGSQKRFPRGDLGVDQRFGDFRLGRTVVAILENGEFERIRPHLTPLECGIIFDGIPEGAISRKVGLIWGNPG